ncbi:MAG: hypothetical protein Unbinned4120contig1000_32 [Prokaryotic dsDNA virus sp.]|jgi:hypothetical protein|nr:MAG: hypothetical protein Unbinned4120contig1000_32 [Prokaryotic dsDNA virus sp.]|tara:strand:- start:33326 stop:33775 length:450 start_codon:yes stop_codon:yes gene_type:complete
MDFSKTFGAQNGTSTSPRTAPRGNGDLPKAQFWLNVGYVVEGVNEDGSDRFVSLPLGIPLDNMEDLPTNQNNRDYAQFMAARNDLKAQLIAEAEKLAPGEDIVIGVAGGLSIQIRRVSDEREAASAGEDNRYAAQLNFAPAQAAAQTAE